MVADTPAKGADELIGASANALGPGLAFTFTIFSIA